MQRASRERHDRLEEQPQLAALDRAVQRVLGRVAGERARAHRVVEHLDAASPALLGVVHRGVGVAQQLVGRLVAGRGERDADAQRRRTSRRRARRTAARPTSRQALRDLDRAFARRRRAQVLAQDRELVAAEAGDGVAGPQHRSRRRATATSSSSPASWPRLSLMFLNRSRSRNSTATAGTRARPARDREPSRSRNSSRFGRLRQRIVHRLVREPVLEGLALDRDRREVRDQREDAVGVRHRVRRAHARRRRACRAPCVRRSRGSVSTTRRAMP